jgi:hypothetical protein
MRVRGALLLSVALAVPHAIAGPPFQSDDPVPAGRHHFELYVYGLLDRATDTETQAPAAEINFGAARNLQLQLAVPFAGRFVAIGTNAVGPGDIELGAKYRFVTETAFRPQIASFFVTWRSAAQPGA